MVGFSTALSSGLISGLAFGLASGLVIGLVHALKRQPKIIIRASIWSQRSYWLRQIATDHIKAPAWVWKFFWQSTLFGGIGGLLIGLLLGSMDTMLVGVLAGGLIGGFFRWLVFMQNHMFVRKLNRWLPNRQVNKDSSPKPLQNLQHSAKSALISGLLYGLSCGLICALNSGSVDGSALELVRVLVFVLSCVLSSETVDRALAYLQNYILCFLLWRSGAMPWRYARFLDYATERILLHKVGNRYMFIHRLLLEYFASLEAPTPSSVVFSDPAVV